MKAKLTKIHFDRADMGRDGYASGYADRGIAFFETEEGDEIRAVGHTPGQTVLKIPGQKETRFVVFPVKPGYELKPGMKPVEGELTEYGEFLLEQTRRIDQNYAAYMKRINED